MMSQILTAVGALLLFLAWAAQQFLYEKWKGRLEEISEAHHTYETYQSNNALFNALIEVIPPEKHSMVWELQLRNYRLGLRSLRESLSGEQEKQLDSKIEERTQRYRGQFPPDSVGSDFATVQAELEIIQIEHNHERESIAVQKATAQRIFWALYAIGSVAVIIGQVLPSP
jgi:hypothetical protein